MPNVLIRNIDKETLDRLKSIAEKNNRSLQGELLEILRESAVPKMEEARNMVHDLLEEYRTEGRAFSDSAEDLSEDRDR